MSALGAFNATVTLSCSGLPAGANCQFQPSSSVVPSSGNPAAVTSNISTSASTPIGTYPVTIIASTPGDPSKSQLITLIVGAAPDYSLIIANPTLVGSVNVAATFNGTVTAANGYSSTVTLSCGAGAPPSCVVNPVSDTPTAGGAAFIVTVSSGMSQAYSFNVVGAGSDPSAITHSASVTFTAMPNQNFDFTMGITPASNSAPVGQHTSFNIDVNPTTGAFPNNVMFSCSKLPALTTCRFNPTQVGSGNGNSLVALTIQTTAPVSRIAKSALSLVILAFPLAGMFCLRRVRPISRRCRHATIALLLILPFISCGGGLQGGGGSGSPGTPPGTYTITITAACGAVTHNAPLSLTVTP